MGWHYALRRYERPLENRDPYIRVRHVDTCRSRDYRLGTLLSANVAGWRLHLGDTISLVRPWTIVAIGSEGGRMTVDVR